MEIAYQIERLLQFAQKHGLVDELDTIYARNALLDLFGLEAPFAGECAQENLTYPTEILDALLDAGAEKGLFDGEVNQFRVNFEARIMGLLMPRESECCRIFEQLRVQQGPKAATDWFYKLCIDTNYIRTAQIAQNIQWNTATKYGDLEITINMTKPEKDPKTIALSACSPRPATPPVCCAAKTLAMQAASTFRPARTTASFPLR